MILLEDAPTWSDKLSAASAAIGAVTAALAWRAARNSAGAAAALTKIEADRWHAELTPQFKVTCQAVEGDRATLRVDFTGPPPLGHLDKLIVTVRDDDRSHPPRGDVTQEDIDAQIWGPYQFIPHIDGGDVAGRTASMAELPLGSGRPFTMRRTGAPRWATHEWWRQEYDGKPIRLTLHCVRGHESWIVPMEVPVDPLKTAS